MGGMLVSQVTQQQQRQQHQMMHGRIVTYDSKWNYLQFSGQIDKISGSFSLRQSHFVFIALSAFSNVLEIYHVITNEDFLLMSRNAMEWQTAFQKLRPIPSAKAPYDEMMIESIFTFSLTAVNTKLMLYGANEISNKKQDSQFQLAITELHCETNRNDTKRTLFHGPIHNTGYHFFLFFLFCFF